MNNNLNLLSLSLLDNLSSRNIKYKVHNISDDLIMIDIWYNDSFYVVQYEKNFIGFSKVDDEHPGFETEPDLKFYNPEDFGQHIKAVLI